MITTHLIQKYHLLYRPSIITCRRFQSSRSTTTTTTATTPISQLPNKNSIYVISIPITTSKSYIYCNHRPSTLSPKQLANIPLIYKLENKLINLASKGWSKLTNSKQSVNQKVVSFIKKLLDTIPYEENCLKSFPTKATMIREINEESSHFTEGNKDESGSDSSGQMPVHKIVQAQVDDLKISTDQLKPIPLYHPQFQNPSVILNQLYSFEEENKKKHKNQAILCAIGIPITLPFALVPILPNVPGFYLAYRLYCNIKALLGLQHLNYLLETKKGGDPEIANQSTVNDTLHITFKEIEGLNQLYLQHNNPNLLQDPIEDDEETVIINEDTINQIVEKFELTNLKEDLLKALKQETKRLNRDIKVEDQVE